MQAAADAIAQVVAPKAAAPAPLSLDVTASDEESMAIDQIDLTFKSTCIDLVSSALNSTHLTHSDEFFAAASNLTNPSPPIRRAGYYVPTGAWFDGWETRRHNTAAYDFVVIRLGVASGLVRGIEVDTAFFNGNQAPAISVDGTYEPDATGAGAAADARVTDWAYGGWKELLSTRECGPSRRHAWRVGGPAAKLPVTHVRLRMYPDGGIARFRLYGHARPVWPEDARDEVELSAATMGGVAVAWSDQHFGTAANLLLPGRGRDMGDGWETARSRARGHVDWAVVRLGARGTVARVVVDTAFFRGNFPRAVRVHALDAGYSADPALVPAHDDPRWMLILDEQPMKADTEFVFKDELADALLGKPFTHFKLTMIPDGGVKRFRVFGRRV